jgi:hypothetical protein
MSAIAGRPRRKLLICIGIDHRHARIVEQADKEAIGLRVDGDAFRARADGDRANDGRRRANLVRWR